jgi:hypothetical protein
VAYKALLIGNWEYADVSHVLLPLKGPRNDLRIVHAALTDPSFGLFDPENVKCSENLTFGDMQTTCLEFLKAAKTEDRLLLYFSGHGERLPKDERLALCGVNTTHRLLDATSFDTDKLRNWIEEDNRAPSTIVILDCCYAGRMKGAVAEQKLYSSLGAGTMVLASGANQPAPDAVGEDEPSPFTAALVRVLLDQEVKGDKGFLTADSVYERLINLDPPLSPRPWHNVQSQGTFALARRPQAAVPEQPELKGPQPPDVVETVDLIFEVGQVSARWETGDLETLDLTSFDAHRQAAVRRLGQLADAVIRVPEYAKDDWYQRAVEKAWNCIGVNLFETSIPSGLAERIRNNIDATGKSVLKVRLAFDRGAGPLEAYPWEYLQVGYASGGEGLGTAQSLPLALRPGLLIERVAPTKGPRAGNPRPADAAWTVGVVNCLYGAFSPAAARVAEDLTRLAKLNVVMDLNGGRAHWGNFLDTLSAQEPRLLLLFAPVRRSAKGVEVGFFPDEPGEPDWHTSSQLTSELRTAELSFDAIVFVTFAALPGQDSFRGTLELASALARSDVGPVVFACHAPGYEAHCINRERDAFPVLFIDALTRGFGFDKAFYYAKHRVIRMASEAVRRTFGVPGYYVSPSAEPKPTRQSPLTSGGQSTEGKESK